MQLDCDSYMEFHFYKHCLNVLIKYHVKNFIDDTGLPSNYHDGSMWGQDGTKFDLTFEDYCFEWQFNPYLDVTLFCEDCNPHLPNKSCRLPSEPRSTRQNLRINKALYERAVDPCSGSPGDDFDLCVDDIMIISKIGLAKV